MTRAELTAWIEDLRGRLQRGEGEGGPPSLADVGPIVLVDGHRPWDAEATARRLLTEVVDGKPMPEPERWPLGRPADW
jgi:hypothetical protein